MPTTPSAPAIPDVSARARWSGRLVTGIAVAFLAFDAVIKVLSLPIAVTATTELGYSLSVIPIVGVIEVVCLALYLWPTTSLLGAVLWVGYLGGAVATHVRAGSPLLSHVLFPIYIAGLLWAGLWLRRQRVRDVIRRAFDAG